MSAALTFFRERFPALFERGVQALRTRATEGSEGARRQLEDVESARGVAWIQLEGAGEVFLVVQEGQIERVDAKPADLPIRVAVALPAEAADAFLAEGVRHVDLDSDDAAYAAARLASGRIEQAIGAEPLECHLILKDTPDFDEVVVRLGLNAPEPPAKPRFTATLRWDDLEALRKGEVLPQQLFMGGRLRLAGDYSRALQLGMQLMQSP